MNPEELARAAETAQSIAVRDYTYSGILLLVLAGGFYFMRLVILKYFAHLERRDAQAAKRDEVLQRWAEGFLAAIDRGAGRISGSIESLESTGLSAFHESETMRGNAEHDRRESERRRHDEAMSAERRHHDELLAAVRGGR